jgi:hypothetical protein
MQIHIHRQQYDLISLLWFFQNKENRLKQDIYIRETEVQKNSFYYLRSGSAVHMITFFSLPCDKTFSIQFPVCSMKGWGHEFWLEGGCARVTRPVGWDSLTWRTEPTNLNMSKSLHIANPRTRVLLRRIWDSHSGGDEEYCFLGCSAM